MNRDYFGYILALVSIIISVFVSWFFYNKSLQYREPHYMTDVFPQSVFDAKQDPTPPFKVTKNDGSPLTTSVYIANHKIWNNGTQPILATDVLKPITVSIEDKDSSILAVSIAKSSREVTDCSVTLDSNTNKSFTVTFKVLEPQDGCLLKVFYTGMQFPSLHINGEFIGVNSILVHNETIIELFDRPSYWGYLERLPEVILFLAFTVAFFFYMRTRYLNRKFLWLRTIVYCLVVLEMAIATELLVKRLKAIDRNIPNLSTEKWISKNTTQLNP